MKLEPDKSETQAITAYGDGWIAVNGERIDHSVVVGSAGERLPWRCGCFADLNAAHFSLLAAIDTELVIFGSGERIRFPDPQWLAPLIERRIGLETMDTKAACRTYNILSAEGRKVVVALLIETTASTVE